MNGQLADALQDCLERLEAGEPLDAALGRHAALAADLRPLVGAALLVRQHRPLPAPGFRARVQVALANADLSASAEVEAAARLTAPPRAGWRPLVARLSGALAAIVMLAGGVVVASANSRPGDMLYPVRRGVEQVQEAAFEALVPAVTGVQAPRVAEPTPPPTQAARLDAQRPAAAGSAARGGPAAAGRDETDDADAGDRRPIPNRRASGSEPSDESDEAAAPDAQGGVTTEDRSVPTTSMPTATAVAEAIAAAPQPTATQAEAERQPAGPVPAESPDTRGTAATPESAPTVEAAPVVVVAVPVQARSGDPRRGGITGRILREDGTPLKWAEVSLYYQKSSGEWDRYGWRDLRTGEDGRYRFDRLMPGRYKVRAEYDYDYGRHRSVRRWYPSAAESEDAEVIVVTGGYIRDAVDIRFGRMPWMSVPIPFPWPWPGGS